MAADFLISTLIEDTAVALTAETTEAADFLAHLTSEDKDFKRFINDSLVLTQSEGSFLCDVITDNSFTCERCHYRGFPGSDQILPMNYRTKLSILSLLPDHDTSHHHIKIWGRNAQAKRQLPWS